MDVLSAPQLSDPENKKRFSLKKRHKGYGIIETGWLHYITPGMIIGIVVPVTLIGLKHVLVYTYFMAALDLNAIIVFMFLIAISKAIRNNIALRKAAFYLKAIENISEKDEPSNHDVEELLMGLKSEGKLYDTNDMEAVVRDIHRYKQFSISDQQARIIKSKVGQRIAESRKLVSFIGGMLVMLGLIGTYTGLLKTVDTVGAVMLKMSSVGSGGGDGMSSFISKLAEPLQGMALAFSASLFGISGSLFVSIYGTITNLAQNEFIENFSRWVDDHIPRITSKTSGGAAKIEKLPSTDDLKAWLAGFVNLSNQTNRKMGQLVYVLAKSTQAAMKSNKALESLLHKQQQTYDLVANTQLDLNDIKQHAHETYKTVSPLSGAISSLESRLNDKVAHIDENFGALQQHVAGQSFEISSASQVIGQLPPVLNQLVHTQNTLNTKLESFPQYTGRIESVEQEMSAVVLQLATMLEEMNHTNADAFAEFLAKDEEEMHAANTNKGI